MVLFMLKNTKRRLTGIFVVKGFTFNFLFGAILYYYQ